MMIAATSQTKTNQFSVVIRLPHTHRIHIDNYCLTAVDVARTYFDCIIARTHLKSNNISFTVLKLQIELLDFELNFSDRIESNVNNHSVVRHFLHSFVWPIAVARNFHPLNAVDLFSRKIH